MPTIVKKGAVVFSFLFYLGIHTEGKAQTWSFWAGFPGVQVSGVTDFKISSGSQMEERSVMGVLGFRLGLDTNFSLELQTTRYSLWPLEPNKQLHYTESLQGDMASLMVHRKVYTYNKGVIKLELGAAIGPAFRWGAGETVVVARSVWEPARAHHRYESPGLGVAMDLRYIVYEHFFVSLSTGYYYFNQEFEDRLVSYSYNGLEDNYSPSKQMWMTVLSIGFQAH